MKKNFKMMLMAMFAIFLCVSFTACSNDDDEKSKSEQIDHVKLVAKMKLSQDLADFIYVDLNGTVLENTGFTKTYQLRVNTTDEQTLEIPLLQAPGKIQEGIIVTKRAYDAPKEITKDRYDFGYELSYTLVEVMKDGKEYTIDTDLYKEVVTNFSVAYTNPGSIEGVWHSVNTVIIQMEKNRNRRFFVEIERTETGMDKVKITPDN